ncbi:MAG: hypothetical protein ACKVU4_15735 [Phycisphaerales bacterium]
MIKSLPSLLLVTLITVLIWVVAENESVRVVPRQVGIEIDGEFDGRRAVRIDPDQLFPGQVTVRLEGATVNIEALATLLSRPIRLTPEMLRLPPTAGRYNADLRAALRDHPIFRDSGVTPTEVRPDSVAVEVDDLVTRPARVSVAAPEGVQLQGAPEPNPAEVSLRLPSRLAKDLPEDLTLTATLDAAVVSRLARGRPQTFSGVRLELPAAVRAGPMGQFARAEPATISVTLTLLSGTDTFRVGAVPVHLRLAPIDYAQWEVEVSPEDQSVGDVEVTGPRDLVARIRDRDVQVFAVVPLSWAELERAAAEGGAMSKEAVFTLSIEAPGALQFTSSERSVALTIRRRTTAVTPGTPGGE